MASYKGSSNKPKKKECCFRKTASAMKRRLYNTPLTDEPTTKESASKGLATPRMQKKDSKKPPALEKEVKSPATELTKKKDSHEEFWRGLREPLEPHEREEKIRKYLVEKSQARKQGQ